MAQPHTSHVFDIIVWWVVRLLYLSALTALIPYGALLLTSGVSESARVVPLASLGVLLVCIFLLFAHYRSVAHTLASLGWMTLVPGVFALFFQIVNPESFIAMLEMIGIRAGLVQMEIREYIEFVVPKVWLFIAVYLLLGFLLIHIAGKMEREHALTEQVRKLFGPRARILRKH